MNRRRGEWLVVMAGLGCVGCGSTTAAMIEPGANGAGSTGGSGAADAATADAAAGDAGPATRDSGVAQPRDGGACGGLGCDGGVPDAGSFTELTCSGRALPRFSRACSADSDCDVVAHQRDCCGSLEHVGVARAAREALAEAEAECVRSSPLCDCLASSARAEDGSSAAPGNVLHVLCLEGACTTRFVPSDCSAGCGAGFSCCPSCGLSSCVSTCTRSCAEGTPGCGGGCFQYP